MRPHLVCLFVSLLTASASGQPLPQAHSHNDYKHTRPLLDALDHGFCSVEADVYAIDGELRVAHDRRDTRPGTTLRKLYLNPLRDRIEKNGGRVYRDGPTFTLLIDFKSKGEPTYQLLSQILVGYRDMLVSTNGETPAVQIVISGNRPLPLLLADKERLCGIDGRLSNLDSDLSSSLMPMISDNWQSHFKWRGEGKIPVDEKEKLVEAVRKTHAAGRRLRFWATPENEDLWRELADAGVDHINTDQLKRLKTFLTPQPPSTSAK